MTSVRGTVVIRSFVLSLLFVVISAGAAHAQSAPQIHVTRVEGAATRAAIVSALARVDLRSCQGTFMGGVLRLEVVIEDGILSVVRASGGEEVRGYARCVRATIARLRLGEGVAGRARVSLVFPSLGLATPSDRAN